MVKKPLMLISENTNKIIYITQDEEVYLEETKYHGKLRASLK